MAMKGNIDNLLEYIQSGNRLSGFEYSLIASVITGLIVATFMFLGSRVVDTFNYIAGKL